MKNANKINIRSLQEEAKRSEDNEAFTVLAKIGNCRIGMGARLESSKEPTFFIEVLVSLCTGHDPMDLDIMERKLSLLRRLKQRGFVFNCEEDGCMSCELTVQSKGLIAEYKTTSSMIGKCMKKKNEQSLADDQTVTKREVVRDNEIRQSSRTRCQ
jgi:hypothetical protein